MGWAGARSPHLLLIGRGLQIAVFVIAKGPLFGVLTRAEKQGACAGRLILLGSEIRITMGAVAPWLVGTEAASAPPVGFASFNFHFNGQIGGDSRFVHDGILRSHISYGKESVGPYCTRPDKKASTFMGDLELDTKKGGQAALLPLCGPFKRWA